MFGIERLVPVSVFSYIAPVMPNRGLDMDYLEHVSQVRPSDPQRHSAGATAGEPAAADGGGEDCPMDDWVVVDPQQRSTIEDAANPASKEVDGNATLEKATDGAALSTHTEGAEEGGGAVYDLWGVVNHYGGLNGGHYTAFALNQHDNRWYDFSDDRVSVVENESNLVTSAAYVLFYKRREAKAGEGEGGAEAEALSAGGADDHAGPSAGLPIVT